MARQTFYVTRDMKHPLYRTRMLTAGQPLDLDAGGARLFRKLGVDLSDQKPKAAEPAEKASMAMTKAQLIDLAKAEGVDYETDDNKADLVRKINAK